VNKKLNLVGKKIYIREWEIQDAQMLATLGESAKIENAELRIIDWTMKFTQTKLGTLPIFNLQHQLLGIISLQPKIRKNRAIFELQVISDGKLSGELISEAKFLLTEYAQTILGITEINDTSLS